ncbi:hypothetical protein RFI_30563 [Reticulomyxa filosa]|uniref:Mitochondrial carrier protein n=1 Tax=Reticulomyxa filosa TaxID=46433 RepID=X6LY35_RETFI|nr:hypothetical protein RFI_30563 [Reticulomyxa filosa]|eukprot:ETO06828.1 hypothetical protein RFI_30563 [Reticulomyxa filosa]
MQVINTFFLVQGVSKGFISGANNQVLTYRNPLQASVHMFRHEGFRSFWKGVGAVVGGAPFASALYFGGVELTKSVGYGQVELNHANKPQNSAMIDFMSGIIGQLCGSLAWVPMDVLKERCQVEGQVQTVISYRTTTEALTGILRHEGLIFNFFVKKKKKKRGL